MVCCMPRVQASAIQPGDAASVCSQSGIGDSAAAHLGLACMQAESTQEALESRAEHLEQAKAGLEAELGALRTELATSTAQAEQVRHPGFWARPDMPRIFTAMTLEWSVSASRTGLAASRRGTQRHTSGQDHVRAWTCTAVSLTIMSVPCCAGAGRGGSPQGGQAGAVRQPARDKGQSGACRA